MPSDPDSPRDVVSDGLFLEALLTPATFTVYSAYDSGAGHVLGDWEVVNATIVMPTFMNADGIFQLW